MNAWHIFISILLLSSCAHKNTKEDTLKYSAQFTKDPFSYIGKYVWAFDLMSSEQVSTHTFYPDSIVYTMTGKVYSTDYTMKKLSYNKKDNKWIGEDQNGIVYALFFKDKTDSTISIYKHKCKTNGLEEALQFTKPTPDVTTDHGWNIYSLNGNDRPDILPISGIYQNGENTISIQDKAMILNGKTIEKISYHSGERRWVGKYKDEYVQIFFKQFEPKMIKISIQYSINPQKLYSTKYETVKNWETYSLSSDTK